MLNCLKFMPHKKRQFENGELYHITLRRIADGVLFKDISSYFRGIFGIYEFNNVNKVTIQKRREARRRFKEAQSRGLTPTVGSDPFSSEK